MRNVTAIVCIAIVGSSSYILGCDGDEVKAQGDIQRYGCDGNEVKAQGDIQRYEREATDLLLHRRKRGLGSILVYGTSLLLRVGSLGLTLAQAITGGCATFPSICRDRTEIEKLDNEIKGLKETYEQKYLTNKEAYFALKNANIKNAHIKYFIEEYIQSAQSLEEYKKNISEIFLTKLNQLWIRFESNPNSTVSVSEYFSSVFGELEYSLSDIRNLIDSKRNNQIFSLVGQYLFELSINRFLTAYSNAYSQITSLPEDIYSTSIWTAMFTADATDAGILLDHNHARYDEVMAKYGVSTKSKVTLGQKFIYTPKVFKQMWTNIKGKLKNIGTSIKKWKRIRNWKGFKGKLKHSLKGPTQKIRNVMKFVTSSSNRKFFVQRYKLSWSQRVMMGLGIIGDAVQIAVQTNEWKAVANEMKKARRQYEKYRYDLTEELANLDNQMEKVAKRWPGVIETFKNLSLSFKSLIDIATEYTECNDVLGLPKLPVDVTSPLFSLDFKFITKASINSAQVAVMEFLQGVDNDMTQAVDQMRARSILYEKVQEMVANEETVQEMLDALQNIYKFSSSQTIKDYGNDLSKKDIVCAVSLLSRTKTIYDFYQLEPFRPRCDVSASTFTMYDTEASRQRVTVREVSESVKGLLTTCTQYQLCPCPALIAQTNNISESDVIDLIRTLRPNQSQYCGTTGCACVDLKS